ncbi:MAG: hypothetical protein VYD18_11050 [Candidatus Latescibacterota bacterium]|nr:hypothetical protein [Candidatus Latescibacterota bacterium]
MTGLAQPALNGTNALLLIGAEDISLVVNKIEFDRAAFPEDLAL